MFLGMRSQHCNRGNTHLCCNLNFDVVLQILTKLQLYQRTTGMMVVLPKSVDATLFKHQGAGSPFDYLDQLAIDRMDTKIDDSTTIARRQVTPLLHLLFYCFVLASSL